MTKPSTEILESPLVLKDEKQLDRAVHALEKMEEVENEVQKEPIKEVEESITLFLKKAMEITLASNQLSSALEQSLIADLDSMTTDEKLALYNLNRQADNDRWSKIINPTLGVLDAQRQQSNTQQEKAGATAVQVNIGTPNGDSKIAEGVSPEIIGGLNTLNELIGALSKNKQEDN